MVGSIIENECCSISIYDTNGNLIGIFNLGNATISLTSAGNVKITENGITAIIDEDSIDNLGFASKQEFINYLIGIKGNCCGATDLEDEQLYAYNYELPSGVSKTLGDIMSEIGAIVGKTFIGVAAVDHDLKPLQGDSVIGTQATTSDSDEDGAHGKRDLDGGGSSQLGLEKYSDKPRIYRKHDLGQTYTAAIGSVAILKLELIFY